MAYKKQRNVNLDALISREDFEASDQTMNTASKISTLSVNDLKDGSGLFLASVRKPDFQRETADWDVDKIVRFIKSFVDGEFIPAVILWRSQAAPGCALNKAATGDIPPEPCIREAGKTSGQNVSGRGGITFPNRPFSRAWQARAAVLPSNRPAGR